MTSLRSRRIAIRTASLGRAALAPVLVAGFLGAGAAAARAQEAQSQDAESQEGQLEQEAPPEQVDATGADDSVKAGRRRDGLSRKQFQRVLSDEDALAKGQELISELLRHNGGLVSVGARDGVEIPLIQLLPGLRYDLLEAKYVVLNRETMKRTAHHFLPRLIHMSPQGEGFSYSEFTTYSNSKDTDLRPIFRRDVMTSSTAWCETDGRLSRDDESAEGARMIMLREMLTGTMPHGLVLSDAKIAFLREDETELGSVGVYLVRVKQPLRFLEIETIDEYTMYVDTKAWTVLGLSYTAMGPTKPRVVRIDFVQDIDVPLTDVALSAARTNYSLLRRAQMQAEGGGVDAIDEDAILAEIESLEFPQALRMPYRRVVHEVDMLFDITYDTEDVRLDPLPEIALQRPWQTNFVWTPDYHADHWDPPKPVGPPTDG